MGLLVFIYAARRSNHVPTLRQRESKTFEPNQIGRAGIAAYLYPAVPLSGMPNSVLGDYQAMGDAHALKERRGFQLRSG
jgi:hypothetical protein